MTRSHDGGLDRIAGVKTQLISSRLLILQSKRLMLNSLQRRLANGARESLIRRIEVLQAEAEYEQHAYRACVLNWGTSQTDDYWVIAYSRLIEMGNALAVKLREATGELPISERYQVSADVEMLEDIVESWTASLRTVMAEAVA